ncbi:hypothetical protein ACKLNR_008849 [Fusarium oxysporum f. sp. zingiberi]
MAQQLDKTQQGQWLDSQIEVQHVQCRLPSDFSDMWLSVPSRGAGCAMSVAIRREKGNLQSAKGWTIPGGLTTRDLHPIRSLQLLMGLVSSRKTLRQQ